MLNLLRPATIKAARTGKLHDGGGLYLHKNGERGKWIFRYTRDGRRPEKGLGTYPETSLAQARNACDGMRELLRRGLDPVETGRSRAAAPDPDIRDPQLAELVRTVFEARRGALRDGGTRGRWLSPLSTHILPALGHRRVSEITRHDIAAALRPVWRSKHPTALRACRRLELIWREAQHFGVDCDPLEVESVPSILGQVIHKSKPVPSTPWQDIPALFARLEAGAADECIRFLILTAVRANGCCRARFAEINGDVWTVPADRVKGREGKVDDFRVPLTPPAMAIIARCREISPDYLFAARGGRPVGVAAIGKRLTALGETGRPHGFRASFRTWAQDNDIPWDIAETALGHKTGSKVQRAYERSDLLDRRRKVMHEWARYCVGEAGE